MIAWKTLAILVPCVLTIDLVWLGLISKSFYAQEIGELMRRSSDGMAPRWGAALLVWILIPVAVVLFVRPLLGEQATAWQAFAWGAVLGLMLYGVYDLTNYAVLEKWTLRVTVVDIAWGGVLCGTAGLLMYHIERWLTS